MLHAYVIHNDPECFSFHEERTYMVVWANNPHDALVIAAEHYDGGDEYPEDINYETMFDIRPVEIPQMWSPHRRPGVEKRNEVLRLAGFAEEGELRCDTCKLAAYGTSHVVCGECYQCDECGCDCKQAAEAARKEERTMTTHEIAVFMAKVDKLPLVQLIEYRRRGQKHWNTAAVENLGWNFNDYDYRLTRVPRKRYGVYCDSDFVTTCISENEARMHYTGPGYEIVTFREVMRSERDDGRPPLPEGITTK